MEAQVRIGSELRFRHLRADFVGYDGAGISRFESEKYNIFCIDIIIRQINASGEIR